MIVPTVIAITALIAQIITHATASPRSGSSPRTRARAASSSISPSPISGKSAASDIRHEVACLGMSVSFAWSDREHFRHGRIAEEQQEPEADDDLRDEHRLRAFARRPLQVAELAVTQARRLGAQTRLG